MFSNGGKPGRTQYVEDEVVDRMNRTVQSDSERDDTSSYMSSSGDSDDSEWHVRPIIPPGRKVDGRYVNTRLNPSQIPDWVHLPTADEPGFVHTIAMLPIVRPYFRKRLPLPTRMLPGYKPIHTKQETDSRRYHVAMYYKQARLLKYGSCVSRGRRKSLRVEANRRKTGNS